MGVMVGVGGIGVIVGVLVTVAVGVTVGVFVGVGVAEMDPEKFWLPVFPYTVNVIDDGEKEYPLRSASMV